LYFAPVERARKIQQTYENDLAKQMNLYPSMVEHLPCLDQTAEDEKSNTSRSVSFKPVLEANVDLMIKLRDETIKGFVIDMVSGVV